MAGAIGAYYRKIPVCHVEAELRSGNIYQPWPEEVNRRVVGTFAKLHCAPTQTSADALGECRSGHGPCHWQHRDRRPQMGDE